MSIRRSAQAYPLCICVWLLATLLAAPAMAQDEGCMKCHAAIVQKPVVHGAVRKGCRSCHEQLDASTEPHRSTGSLPHGLAALGQGLCAKCHDAELFRGKSVHAPVAAGQCRTCHTTHASQNAGLLIKPGATLCFDCHADVKKRPHVIVAFAGGGHPLGDVRPDVDDPLRPGKKFYCASCHEPHRSTQPLLTRFGKGMAACQKCHNV